MKKKIGMTEMAMEIAKRAHFVTENIITFSDDKGEVRVDTEKGIFIRIYPDGRTHTYKSGEFSTSTKCYGVVMIYLDGMEKAVYAHILMAALTKPEGYKKGLVVGHKDSIKWNNSEDNLEWVTAKDNARMNSLVYYLQTLYPDKYTSLKLNLNLEYFIASKYKINHSDIDKIYAVIGDVEALDELFSRMN
jgi:hypothetical protein